MSITIGCYEHGRVEIRKLQVGHFSANESSSVAPVGLTVCHVLDLSLVELFVAAVKVHCFTGSTCLRHTNFEKS